MNGLKKILAIGGAVIKTAKDELRQVIETGTVEMLIHNGGSIFHDFQQAIDPNLEGHSYPLSDLLDDYECNRPTSKLVWKWLSGWNAPEGSVTQLCHNKGIPVLMFTAMACDFWQIHGTGKDWEQLGHQSFLDFKTLVHRFQTPFHYICQGSAVIHPEVFIKAVAESHNRDFTADVVDFKEMYRPRSRVAKFGTYYKMTHKEFLNQWLDQFRTMKKE
jgi:hypothetical protein